MSPDLIKKHQYNVGWLGKTLHGKLNVQYVVLHGGKVNVVAERESLNLGRSKDVEVYEVDMSEHPLHLTGTPETSNSAFLFSITIDIAMRVENSEHVVRINQPTEMLARQVGSLARTVASKYAVGQYMHAEAAIHHALSKEDFSATGLTIDRNKITVKITLGSKETKHIEQQADMIRNKEKGKREHELALQEAAHKAELARVEAEHKAKLAQLEMDAEIGIQRKKADYVEELLAKGDVGMVTARMLDDGYSMQQILDQMVNRRDGLEGQKLAILQELVKNGLVEGYMVQPYIDAFMSSMMNYGRSGSATLSSGAAPANTPAIPSNVPPAPTHTPHPQTKPAPTPTHTSFDANSLDDDDSYTQFSSPIDDDSNSVPSHLGDDSNSFLEESPRNDNPHRGFQNNFEDDDDFDDSPPGNSLPSRMTD